MARLRELVSRLALIEMTPPVLARALEPFPTPVRTLDAFHIASIEFLRAPRQTILLAAAEALGIPIYRT